MSYRVFESSSIAKDYALYRPVVPDQVTDSIIEQVKIKNSDGHPTLVVDVGCGSGQFTQSLARHFDRVLGFDISEAQIEEARSLNRYNHVEYGVSPAEKIQTEADSVDLVAVSQAAHWFDFPAFCLEADRVLRPGGHVVVVCAIRKTLHHDVTMTETRINECNGKYMSVLNTFRLISTEELETFYGNLKYPYAETKRDSIGVTLSMTSAEYLNMIKTMSYSLKFKEQHPGTAYFDEFEKSLDEAVTAQTSSDRDASFRVTFWHDIFLGQKPQSSEKESVKGFNS